MGNIAPVTATAKRPQLKRYLLAVLGLVSLGLSLALIDERWDVSHLTTVNAILMVAVAATGLIAIHRTRVAEGEPIRTVTPSVGDPVTGLPDERYFWYRLREEYKQVHRYKTCVSVAIIDVNHLASVNGRYGKACGDAVLSHIADVLESSKRASDVAARLSDDELAVILLECTKDGASAFEHRLEYAVNRQPSKVTVNSQALTLWVGVCTGVATAMEGEANPEELVARARQDLEAAKEERDRRREFWTSTSA